VELYNALQERQMDNVHYLDPPREPTHPSETLREPSLLTGNGVWCSRSACNAI
jgi:hypothetical protein